MPYPHRDILAVTFTNKATEEMTKRIVHELALIAGRESGWEDKSSPYSATLIKDLQLTGSNNPDKLLASYAGKCLDALLADFDHFSVSTIDAFFQTILRAFTHEAELAGDYELELDDKTIISKAVAQLLEDIDNNKSPKEDPDNKYLSEQLKVLMENRLANSSDPNFFNREGRVQEDIVKYIDAITDETFAKNYDAIVSFFADTKKFEEFKSTLNDTANIEEDIRQLCKNTYSQLDGASQNTLKLFEKPDKYIDTPEIPKSATFRTALTDPESNYKKNCKPADRGQLLQQAAIKLAELVNRLRFKRMLSQQMGKATILKRIFDAMEVQRSDTSTILLSDTNALLRNIISEDESPFIYERIGNRYRHFLIDEFQDTSAMQWEIFKPLLLESLSRNEENIGDNESLIIGDEKQSIYGFRNSDATMLTNLSKGKEIIPEQCRSTSSKCNWRSSHPVVTFNNIFFTMVAEDDNSLTDLYSNVVQEAVDKTRTMHGRIHAQPLPVDKKTPQMGVEDILDNIIEQLERGFKPGDIAVLVRTNKMAQDFIDGAGDLARQPIPEDCDDTLMARITKRKEWLAKLKFAGEDSVSLTSSSMVQLVINILRFIGASDFTLYEKNVSEKELALIFSNFEREIAKGRDPSDALSETLAKHREGGIEMLKLDADTDPDLLTLPSMVERIINIFVSEEMRDRENLYLSTLLDTVNRYCTFGIPDIRSFLSWWDSKGSGIKLSVGRDREALTVMTVHKSKGLEFPCVHYVALPAKNRSDNYKWIEGQRLDWIPEDIRPEWFSVNLGKWMMGTPLEDIYTEWEVQNNIDEVNLVYVAMTRAVNELNIYYIHHETVPEAKDAQPVSIYDKIGLMLRRTAEAPNSGIITEDNKVFTSEAEPQRYESDLSPDKPGALDPDPVHPTVPPLDMVIHEELWQNTVLENDTVLTDEDEDEDEQANIGNYFEPDEELRALRSILADLTNANDKDTVCLRHAPSPVVEAMLTICLESHPEWFGPGVTTARVFKRQWKNGTWATAVADRLVVKPDGSMEMIVYKNSGLPATNQEAKVNRLLRIVNRHQHRGLKAWIWDLATGEAKAFTPAN